MSYPPPSNQGQPQYGSSGYYPPSQPDIAEHQRRRRRKRITAGAILGTAASIATILTLFITLDQQPQNNNIPNNSQNPPATAYPVNVQSNFLNSCETNGPQNVCQCSLNWFEQHVSLSQFQRDETDIEQGGSPVDISNVEQACG